MFNPFKSRDRYFLVCKIVTLIVCLPWPLTIVATVMSLAGHVSPGTPAYKVALGRLAAFLVLVYPVVYFAIFFFAERVVARKSYPAAAVLAVLPTAFSVVVLADLILT